ncbi:uncharacterized protein BDW47DRAFT_97323 [Aspergillus candidus]|uniref:Uncharacterized protein n=1 Tax=Aspergillus candidus TaxID=41067 RepID=A0A2I2FPG5_ASPCN|nr:hypothetical protein BDW47DRAFT_97323 [Aspergillus candidus]PLB42516.1 hypothetical protein BDW47DRAFT_97323 [Aspergillus candidus]
MRGGWDSRQDRDRLMHLTTSCELPFPSIPRLSKFLHLSRLSHSFPSIRYCVSNIRNRIPSFFIFAFFGCRSLISLSGDLFTGLSD